MLLELSIKDFAIIDELKLRLGPGMTVFTGETGAGKSIIINALDLLLGERAQTDLIRSGADEAVVEALFALSAGGEAAAGAREALEEAGISVDDTLVIKRIVQREGRNRIYLNGTMATLQTLSAVTGPLIDLCGQSRHQSLIRVEEHIEVLDAYAVLGGLREDMASSYQRWSSVKSKLEAVRKDIERAAEERELKEFQLKEIREAALTEGEDTELTAERERLRNFEKIVGTAAAAEESLYSGEQSIVEKLGSIAGGLKEIAALDERLGPTAEAVESSLFELEEAALSLRDFSTGEDFDPERLIEVDDRLDLIAGLTRKYGGSVQEILKKEITLSADVERFDNFDDELLALGEEFDAVTIEAKESALALTRERNQAAKRFKADIEGELSGLGMEGSLFDARITTNEEGSYTAHGADNVAFFISTNPGEDLKPLNRVASGGELSRIMLAIKKATSERKVPTLIFDEVDTGVGGSMGAKIGAVIKAVSMTNQVLCITHLPQIGALADNHFSVSKGPGPDGRTVTTVSALGDGERLEEITRMLGGEKITETTVKHAMELLEMEQER